MFSPYYALARRRGVARPLDHCAFNFALYGEGGARWTMTERGERRLARDANSLRIGPSAIRYEGGAFILDIDEISAPLPSRVRGRIRIMPEDIGATEYALDPAGRHVWRPIAPRARIEVVLQRPALSWTGACYVDFNCGAEPLEDAFCSWNWSRAHLRDGAAVLYEALRRDGGTTALALRFGADGCAPFEPPPRAILPKTSWRMERATRADAGAEPSIAMKFEDSPFYSRSLLKTRLLGEDVMAVHESLSLDRFRQPLVQLMLPFRMPRRA